MKSYRVREKLHDDLLQDMLYARGVEDREHRTFLNPDFERDSHDPYLLPDMGAAVERMLAAKKNNEKVAVWSDYDCDGIPGGVMLAEFLRGLGLAVTHYIPHRHDEGYGLNVSGIDELKNQSISLIVTVDLGTTDHECIFYAKGKGIDTIVTDHHVVSQKLPDALVINPKRPDSQYPFSDLCGAGVAWKLVQAILLKNRPEGFSEGREKWLLDLVGLATLSDMVPLRGENRMLAHFGLAVLRRARRPGFAALFDLLRIRPQSLTEDDIAFMVSPRINAASRMGSPAAAAALLGATAEADAMRLARELNSLNDERKGVVAATVKEIRGRLARGTAQGGLVVMGNPTWRPGILGLVANSLLESQGGTVCLWGREGGEVIRGSCRSGEVNVVELLRGAGDIFKDFGGHTGSGGFSVAEDAVHELPARFAAAYERARTQASGAQEVVIDRELDLAEVTHAQKSLERLAPFGIGFEKPLFIFPRVSIGSVRAFGKQQNHLELRLSRGEASIASISFFATPDSFSKKVAAGERADIVGHIERDWRGASRLRIVDIL